MGKMKQNIDKSNESERQRRSLLIFGNQNMNEKRHE